MNNSRQLNELRGRYNVLRGKRNSIRSRLKETKSSIKSLKSNLENHEVALIVLKEYLGIVTDDIVKLFEDTISAGLKRVFDESYEFKLELKTGKRGGRCEFMIHTDEYEGFLPLNYTQGSLLNQVISVLCRIILVSIDPNLHKSLVLDEPFAGCSNERIGAVSEMIADVCRDFGTQIIMVTHHKQTIEYADKVFEL